MTMMTDDITVPQTEDTTATAVVTPEAETSSAPAPEPSTPPAPQPEKKAEPAMSDADLFEAAMAELDSGSSTPGTESSSYRRLTKGERVEATVILVEKNRVFVDLGTKSEGVIPLAELSAEALETAEGQVHVGDKIQVIVIKPEGSGGEANPIVSKKKADFEEVWVKILAKHQSGESITANVINRVKGGLEVDLGVRGFVPATHVGNGKIRNLEKFVGQTLDLKIIEVDRDRKKVVLSNRQAEEQRREEVKDKIFKEMKPGDIVDGTVRRLAEYGAFVDLGGMDGLLHISEMSWMRINHPKEVLKEGQELKVMILRLDEGNGKISLGLRQVLPDPWKLIKEAYKIGQRITITIGRLVQSGAFIKLPEGAEAFLPASEMSNKRISKPSDAVTEGQEIEVVVIDLRPDERRMVLSMRSAGTAVDIGSDAPYEPASSGGYGGGGDDDDRFGRKGGKKAGGKKGRGGGGRRGDDDDFDGPIVGRVPTGGATIGERLGMLKGFLSRDESEEESDDSGADKE